MQEVIESITIDREKCRKRRAPLGNRRGGNSPRQENKEMIRASEQGMISAFTGVRKKKKIDITTKSLILAQDER